MKHGFIKVAVATPDIRVADTTYNTKNAMQCVKNAEKEGAKLVVLPELCLTGYTCGDLFLQDIMLTEAKEGLKKIVDTTKGMDVLAVIGLPYMSEGKLYNVAAIVQNGKLLGMIPKLNLPNYSEFYEARHFTKGNEVVSYINFFGDQVPFGSKVLFQSKEIDSFVLGVEICEDLWVAQPPSGGHAMAGATVIANVSASDETTGKDDYRKDLIKGQSARLISGYLYSTAGEGESTTDLVFSAHNMITENGNVLKESQRFVNGMIVTELDLGRLISERRRMSTYPVNKAGYETVVFSYPSLQKFEKKEEYPEVNLTRYVDKAPFVPSEKSDRQKRCDEIIHLQALGLKKRLMHTGQKHAVIGISGGLDSTLALLVIRRAFDMLGLDPSGIIAVTMPCFGTTDRTYNNAVHLVNEIGATLKEVKIAEAVMLHFHDIEHDPNNHDVTYENSQARERTQVLMDIANKYNCMVIGTGDMSELALGWATYNGDHMSMYGVNVSVPKTLVRYLVAYFAEETKSVMLRKVLLDILDTPVSPELLPPSNGEIAQKTEDIVGPYELHDFFLYYVMRFGYAPSKIYRLAVYAFNGEYENAVILKWLKVFYRRFFSQQFKRSCMPDGPKVGSVALSPRGDWRMPSDACATLWLQDLEKISL